jgi:hypothetical protein
MPEAAVLDRPVDDDEKAMLLGRLINGSWDWYDCFIWERASNGVGYGQITFRGQRWYTHRLAYSVWKGPISDGLVLDHLCRNTLCWRPTHLEPVTTLENLKRGLVFGRTHCKNGHEFTEANTYFNARLGHRACRACRAARERARRKRLFNIGRGQ